MTAVVVAVCVAFLAGYLVRSKSAKAERKQWLAARCRWRRRLREVQEQLAYAQEQQAVALANTDRLRDQLGADEWLYGALRTAHAEMLPGEHAVNLTLEVQWRDARDMVLIGIDRGETVAERAAMVHLTDGERRWQQPEEIDFPEADSPEWGSG